MVIEIPGYRILRELGHGGMATVYLAEQSSLGRRVALKVLHGHFAAEAGFTERFLREGRIAANLHHRHIVAIHDVGQADGRVYMAMEYLPQGSIAPLAGQMAEAEVLRCLREIAGALDAAHRQGVVHRDVKPENILRHDDGAFLLTDFGIARIAHSNSVVTREGSTVGTPAYMSPEQWRNEAVDGRADLYGLGVVLYQMLTGRLPYSGSDGWAVGMQHMSAPLPALPPPHQHLQALLDALLAKNPGDRIGTGADLVRRIAAIETTGPVPLAPDRSTPATGAATLPLPWHSGQQTSPPPANVARPARKALPRGWLAAGVAGALLLAIAAVFWPGASETRTGTDTATTPAPAPAIAAPGAEIPTLAVMPCSNHLGQAEWAWLGEGLAGELIQRLSRLRGVTVVSRTSSFALDGANLTASELGQRLGAGLLVTCSLRQSRDGIRITAELTDTASNTQRWSAQHDRDPEALLAAIDEIAVGIAERLLASLVGEERALLLRHDTDNLEALRLYLEVLPDSEAWTEEGMRLAEPKLQRALELDPDFALAHYVAANLWMNRMQIENLGFAKAAPKIEQALQRALALDPDLAEAHALQCQVHMYRYEWAEARAECDHALLLAPDSARVHYLVGQYEYSYGDAARGIEHMARFRELEPDDPFAGLLVAAAHLFAGDRDTALTEAEKTIARSPESWLGHWMLGWVLRESDRCPEAVAAYERAADLPGGDNLEFAAGAAGGAYACAGRLDEARAVRERLLAALADGKNVDHIHLAAVELALGDADRALDALEAGHRNFDHGTAQAVAHEHAGLSRLRGHPRYEALRAKYNFPPRD